MGRFLCAIGIHDWGYLVKGVQKIDWYYEVNTHCHRCPKTGKYYRPVFGKGETLSIMTTLLFIGTICLVIFAILLIRSKMKG